MIELTAHRTLALRNAVAENPHVALTALLHRLVVDTFGQITHRGCVEASVREIYLPAQAADLKDSLSAKAIAEREQAWKGDIPLADDEALWAWLDGLDDASRLARTTGLDMVEAAGGPRSTTISAASPSPASSKPSAKAPASGRRS